MNTSRVTGGNKLQNLINRAIQAKCDAVAESAAQMALREVFRETPVEDGHAHQAWLSGGTEAIGAAAQQSFAESGVSPSSLSADPTAVRSGEGRLTHGKLRADVVIKNHLGFVKILEYGGVLRPIGPGGRKIDPVQRPPMVGPLYGARSSQGNGMLVWTTPTGETMRAPSRSYTPGRYVGRALNLVRNRYEKGGGR